MAPGNDATFLWRHAADRRFGAAVDNTRRCRHPIPAPPFRPLPFPRFARVRGTPMVSRAQPPSSHREVGTLSGAALEPPTRRPVPPPSTYMVVGSVRGLGFGGSRTWVWCLPRTLTIAVRIRTRPSTFLLLVGRKKSSEPSAYTVVGFGKDDAFQPSLRPPVVVSVVGGLRS